MTPTPSTNKDLAISFLKLVTSGSIQEAYDVYIASDFRHHNAYFKGDAESLKQGMSENHAKFPNKVLEIQHVLEDGDLVAVHSRIQLSLDQPSIAAVHICRFAGEKIIEMWDVGQTIPVEMPNENGMF